MELTINNEKNKELLTEFIFESRQLKVFHKPLTKIKNINQIWKESYANSLEALEEVVLANAIKEGRNNDFVDEEVIFSILDGDEA